MARFFLQQRNINLVPVLDQTSIVWNTAGDGSDVNTWEELYSLIQRVEVPMLIYLDRQNADPPFEIPEGEWDLHNSWFISKTSEPQTVTVLDGAVINNFAGIDGIVLVFQNTAPVIVDPPRLFQAKNSTITVSGTAPVFTVTSAAGVFILQLFQTSVNGVGVSTLINLVDAGAQTLVQLLEGSYFDTNIVSGAVGSQLQFEHNGATSFPLPGQAAMGGTITNHALGVVGGAGPAAMRPSNPTLGTMYFDTDEATPIPIWWDGAQWVDATGTAV